jgi:N-ethylmaleimide reductase
VSDNPAVLRFTSLLRSRFGGPLIVNGGFDRETAVAAVASGEADLVAFGTAFLANPDLPMRLRSGAVLNTPDRSTFHGGSAHGYTDYPTLDQRAVARV